MGGLGGVDWKAVALGTRGIKLGGVMFRRIFIGAIGAVALAASWAACLAGSIELQSGVKLEAGGQVIDDHRLGHFVPTVVDWNGDGKKDLIVGSFTGEPGNVRLLLNVGTDADPKFDKPTFLEANGQPIKLTGG